MKVHFRKLKKVITFLLLAIVFLTGCGSETAAEDLLSDIAGEAGYDSETGEDAAYEEDTGEESSGELISEDSPDIAEDGSYDSRDEVALYINQYHKLPANYITKKEAKKLGWEGGSVEDFAPGKCIGGDHFGNYEGRLPEDDEYHECDIDTLGGDGRGAKRIIYSDDYDVYYTDDHYESFSEAVFDEEGGLEWK